MLIRILLVVLVFSYQTGFGASVLPVADVIRDKVEQIRAGTTLDVGGQTVSSVLVLPALYERYNYTPIWNNPRAVRQLIEALEQVINDGLVSSDYHLPAILALHADNSDRELPTAADLDILMTDALIRLGYHLLVGKVDVEELDAHWNMTTTIGDLDTILSFAEAIESAQIPELIEQLRPNHPYYENLRQGLARYRAIREKGGWPNVEPGSTLKPGMTDKRILQIRARLNMTGELVDAVSTSDAYDETLVMAVKKFQENHGLTPDGIIGPASLAAMNVPVQERINQIKVNLERARWVLHDMQDEFVMTDIAGYEVSYRRGGKIIWTTRAQVGKPYRKTPVFKDQIRYLEVNPTWTVPTTILRNDILPRLAKDSAYLQQMDM
ncbi:MAG: L,D-transpeptidase family protein, partial [Deltaproteobacteria bacterium]|nr:L,D-transpeptidase family protein [Deltaproteobacteria bacterium]